MKDQKHNAYQPQYDLFIRRTDQSFRLIEQKSGYEVAIKAWHEGSGRITDGLFIQPQEGTGVFLMPDEIHIVEEFAILCNF